MENEKDFVPQISEKKSNKRIVFGTLLQYVLLVIQIVSGFVLTPLISSHYGVDDYGIMMLANSFVAIFLTDIGLSALSNKYLSEYKAKGQYEELRSLLGLIYKIFWVLSGILLVIFIVCFFCSEYIFVSLEPDQLETFRVIFGINSLFSVLIFSMNAFSGVLLAYEEYVIDKLLSILGRVLYIVLILLGIFLDWPIFVIGIISSSCTFLTYLIMYLVIRFKLKIKADFHNKEKSAELKKNIFSFSIWIAVGAICWRLYNYLGPSILGIVSPLGEGASNVAIYNLAANLENYTFMVAGACIGFFIPKLSRIFVHEKGEQRSKHILDLAVKVGTLISSLVSIIFIGFICCGQEFLYFWMEDPTYQSSYSIALVLMAGYLVSGPVIIQRNSLYFENNYKYYSLSEILFAIVFLALAFPLGYFFGPMGVAIAVFVGNFVFAMYINIIAYKKIGFNVILFYKKILLKQILPVVILLVIGLPLHFYLPLANTWRLLIIVIVLCGVGLPLYWFFVFDKELRKSLVGLFKKEKSEQTDKNLSSTN